MKIYLVLFMLMITKVMTFSQNVDSLFNESLELIRLQSFCQAIPCLQKAHELAPKKLNIMLQLAFCYTQTKELDKSAFLYRQIIQNRPEYTQGYYMLGNVLLLQKDYSNALIMSNKALDFDCDNADHLLLKGQILIEIGDKKKACKYFKKAKRNGSEEAKFTMSKYCK